MFLFGTQDLEDFCIVIRKSQISCQTGILQKESQIFYLKYKETYNYADSEKYFSWEQYYTALITQMTEGTELQYSKFKFVLFVREKFAKDSGAIA